ncbi:MULTISPECIES: xanthine dehydrogenase molybdopterin binding subunit [Marinomonas]|uniref:Xanthine dehydrogenase molybdopterin binding subunit n=1 Tax=Marinomonas arctica TaxID=383750 RepID=A0A7H1J205_9GAMM|nr:MULTISPECIES: xanthine dehydrogenase molybdopterin binding subunit [Marinomonas]MCS7488232.1 aldehyde oxidase [Marinomonas sp. BSi20414]QNT04521.1 xanthine dehydrogenase molybdopterin binding subunit [Marinomonas arctica]GGN37021.1 xanthine dehydrogenase molybdopterin binding subunit [Marinomonas arctica]
MRKLPQDFAISSQKGLLPIHESAIKHVTGQAIYIDDMPEWPNELHVATGLSTEAHADIVSINLDKVRAYPGVVDVIVQADIPGDPDVSPVLSGDLMLAGNFVHYIGQPIFAVAATSLRAAKQAVRLAEIVYQPREATLHPRQSLERQEFVLPTHTIQCGNATEAMAAAPRRIKSDLYIKGQEHFYLEGQISVAVPNEDGGVQVFASSQHPAEVQKLVARVLGLPVAQVLVEVRRMGGGFGGKESQAAVLGCTAAVLAVRNGCPVKYRMPRQDDMVQTGKRHDFWNSYQVGFSDEGEILAAEYDMVGKCGCTADLSDGVVDRAMFHADNAYFLPNARISGYRGKTHTVSNTAFRGFGGPKGVLLAENVIEEIACAVGKDALDIRKLNCYQAGKDTTPYGQKVDDDVLLTLMEELEASSDYRARRQAINAFNKQSPFLKKGLALTPVKFGISFTSKHLNQGGALLHVYTDGSVHVSHGGTEMGQGLYTKVAQIVAKAFGIDYQRVNVGSTRTDKVPNASPTAASAGTDLNGMAALDAAMTIKGRLQEFAMEHFAIAADAFAIEDDQVILGSETMGFPEFIKLAYMNRVSLSSTGFYKTPKIGYDRKAAKGRPFLYYANGAAVAEVIVDTFTGEYKVTQVDILHDVGDSINADIDIGQIEGAFVQGMGWLTSEELSWDDKGRITTNSPANYKIPTSADIPEKFTVKLFDRANSEESVYRSKAVGEPPLMLGISVWCALKDACASVADHKFSPPLAVPATPEAVYYAMQAAQNHKAGMNGEVAKEASL